MTRPNIALFSSSFAPHIGGVETLTAQLATALRSRGGRIIVVTNRYPKTLPPRDRLGDVPIFRERFRFPEPRPRHLAGYVAGTRRTRREIIRALRAHETQVVHVHAVSSNAYYAVRAAEALGLPLVVTLHGELTMDADQAYQRSATRRRMWRHVLAAADVVTGVSRQVVDEAVAEFGDWLSPKTSVIRNGIDIAAIRAAVPGNRSRPYILGLGRLVPQKGFDVLIDAFRLVQTEFPEIDLVIAGEGPEHARLVHHAAGSRTEFVGGVPAGRAFSLFRGASAFVLPSRHEPQGIVLLEAMAAGVPVVAADVGGVPEVIHHGSNGLLVPGENPAALADALRKLLEDRDGSGRLSARASRDVESYSLRNVVDQYEDCYALARGTAKMTGRAEKCDPSP